MKVLWNILILCDWLTFTSVFDKQMPRPVPFSKSISTEESNLINLTQQMVCFPEPSGGSGYWGLTQGVSFDHLSLCLWIKNTLVSKWMRRISFGSLLSTWVDKNRKVCFIFLARLSVPMPFASSLLEAGEFVEKPFCWASCLNQRQYLSSFDPALLRKCKVGMWRHWLQSNSGLREVFF